MAQKIYNCFTFLGSLTKRFIEIRRGKRKGLILDLERRKKKQCVLPLANAVPKYSTTPHPLMRLSRLALPAGSDSTTLESAVEKFSASVTKDTQGGYATATRHYFAAEVALGRKFNLPPTELEYVFLTTYLMNQNLTVSTIQSYLAGIRFYLLS